MREHQDHFERVLCGEAIIADSRSCHHSMNSTVSIVPVKIATDAVIAINMFSSQFGISPTPMRSSYARPA
jgi:hypothetical protein